MLFYRQLCNNSPILDRAYRYGGKLNFEKELGLRLKGENGIMKKKFSALQKDIEDQREEIKTMFAHKKELYQAWRLLLPLILPHSLPLSPLLLIFLYSLIQLPIYGADQLLRIENQLCIQPVPAFAPLYQSHSN